MDLRKEFKRDIRNGRFEQEKNGLFLPRHKIIIGGVFSHELIRDGESLGVEHDHNLMVDEGLNHILSVAFHGASGDAKVDPWYIGIFEGNYTPLATDTAANIATNATESTAYDEAARPTWDEAAPASKQITNSASKATFTINATKTIYGAFLVSSSTKGGTSGTLAAASKFAAARSVVAADQLLLTYTLSAADA